MSQDKKESAISIATEENHNVSGVSTADQQNNYNNDQVVDADSDDDEIPLEAERLGGKSPLATFLILCAGPLCAQITNASYGLLNTFWVSRSTHPTGAVAISVAYPIGFFVPAFAQFMNVAMSDRISYLFGRKEKNECAQVVVDILRFSIIIGIILPCIILPCLKPIMKWYGGTEENQHDLLLYMLPSYCGSFILLIYFSICGLLQAMGNSFIFAICQLSSGLMNGLIFGPLFVKTFNWGVWGSSFGNVISNLIPCLALFICLFTKKLIVKPEMSMFCKPFNKHSFLALKVAIGQLLSQLANSIPIIVLTEWIEEAGSKIDLHGPILQSWNVVARSWGLAIAIVNGLNQGFLPAASFAYGSSRLHRLLILIFIVIGIGTGALLIFTICIECIPETFAKLWDKNIEYVKYTSQMLKLIFSTVFLNQIIMSTIVCLQAVKKAAISIIVAVVTMLLPTTIFGAILFYTKKNDPVRLMFAFVAHDLFSLVIVIIVMVVKLKFLLYEAATDIMHLRETEEQKKMKKLKEQMIPEESV